METNKQKEQEKNKNKNDNDKTKEKPKINKIDEYFSKTENQTKGNELFRVSPDNVDIKTELTDEEIKKINTLFINDEILQDKGLKPAFSKYIEKFMRLKISFERKGRTEFVKINSDDRTDQFLETAGGLSNIFNAKN